VVQTISKGECMKTASAFLATTLTLLPLTTGAFAQTTTTAGTSTSSIAVHRAAPGPLMGAGPVGLVVGGIGFGVYWLVKRRRRKTKTLATELNS
jgi:hypothetical protein